jgi:hypothetical protein
MGKKHPNDGPTFTKRKPIPYERRAPDPARREAELEDAKQHAEKSRSFSERVTEVGLFRALFSNAAPSPDKATPPIVRRRLP